MESERENLSQSLEEIRTSMKANQKEISSLEAEKFDSLEKLGAARGKMNKTSVELKEAVAKITDMEKQHDDLKELLEAKEGEFVQSLDELENDLAEKARQTEESKATIKQLEKSVDALKTDLVKKSEQYNQSENSIKLLEETIETLQSNVSKLEDSVGRSANSLSEKSRQTDEANATIKQLEESIETLKLDLVAKSEQYTQSETNMKSLEETMGALKKDLSENEKVN